MRLERQKRAGGGFSSGPEPDDFVQFGDAHRSGSLNIDDPAPCTAPAPCKTVRSPPIANWEFPRMPRTSGWPTVEPTGEGCGAEPTSAAGLADRLSRSYMTGPKS